MELIKIINAKQTLEAFSAKEEVDSHLAYWMTKFVIKTQAEYDFFISEMQKLINTYAAKDEDGKVIYDGNKNITIKTECIDEFNKKSVELQNTDVEAPDIKFSLSELSKELKMSMRQMSALIDFIDEGQ